MTTTEPCPYQCNSNNMILDRARGELVPCPHCGEVRRERYESMDGSLPGELGFSSKVFTQGRVTVDDIIPSSEMLYLEKDSVEEFQEVIDTLWGKYSQRELPDRSICLGIGMKGRITKLLYPLLAAAYGSGLTTAPIATANEITWWKLKDDVDHLSELCNAQVAAVVIEEGCTRSGLQAAKGVMQTRALKGNHTLILTTWSINGVNTLLDVNEDAGLFLADPVFLRYSTGNSDKYSNYTMGVLGVKNSMSDFS